MADRRYSFLLAVAVLTAGAATFGVYRVLENTKANNRVETVPVVVATQDIPEGFAIERIALAVNQWPAGTMPAGAFSSADSLVGRVARVAIYKGEPIVPGRLAPDGTGPGLAVKIATGKRAIAVQINDVAGISGLIQPNSRVDVLVTLRGIDAQQQPITTLFMENMRVLSVGTIVQPGPDNRPINATTATLEVTPEEAEQLVIAQREGTIQLALRGYGDPDSVKTSGARAAELLGELRNSRPTPPPARRSTATAPRRQVAAEPTPPPPVTAAVPAAPPKPDSVTVEIYRGETKTQQKFAKPDSVKKP
jgi:pilus assembly protein CpaB